MHTEGGPAMRRGRRCMLALLVCLALAGFAAPASAGSCGKLRSHAGAVTALRGDTLTVARGGGTSSFKAAPSVRVVDEAGTGVGSWSGLRAGLRVTVCWAFDDTPRMARIVYVTGGEGR